MMSVMTAFLIAVGGASLIFYLLMARAQDRSAEPDSSASDSAATGGQLWFGGDGWNVLAGSAVMV